MRKGRVVFQSQPVTRRPDELHALWRQADERAQETGKASDAEAAKRLLWALRDARRDAERGAADEQRHETCGGLIRTVDI